jgi:hypothetical protein
LAGVDGKIPRFNRDSPLHTLRICAVDRGSLRPSHAPTTHIRVIREIRG